MHVSVPHDTASLGLTLQYSPIALAANIWHVLDVAAKSPADEGGLLPYSDYILGSPEGSLTGESALGELVEDHIGRPLRLFVYNNEYDVTREVTIHPSRGWGGEGALGCVLGYGALHRLPAPLSEPVNAPGETMFDGVVNEKRGGDSAFLPTQANAAAEAAPETAAAAAAAGGGGGADYLVPAQMVDAASAPPPPRTGKKKDRQQQHANADFMDDYFKEEEEKSRELDNAPAGKGSGVPPPPKAPGGPPPKVDASAEESKSD